MRLINNATLELESFMDLTQAPPYAILSHTWGDGEVTLQDFTSPDREAAQRLAGFAKIELICRQALIDELPYSWVDTCCIDKTSSAELTEAINSMYEWYKASAVCYVFLPDLSPEDPVVLDEDEPHLQNLSIDDQDDGHKKRKPSSQFAALRWFTRGWTLQELIAPPTVLFYDASWTLRGTKASLAFAISVITRIEEPVLHGKTSLDKIPIARRMSWAAGRTTTRAEDIAYCLLGIFDVNMPMLYGEGPRAFIRLQEEIMHESNDLSLFAWRAASDSSLQQYRGVLALSPQEFADCGSIEIGNDSSLDVEFSLTNKGIRIKTKLEAENGKPLMVLNCKFKGKPAGIYLHQHGGGVYARAMPDQLAIKWMHSWEFMKEMKDPIYLSKRLSSAMAASIGGAHRHGIHLRGGFKFTSSTGFPGNHSSNDASSNHAQKVSWVHPGDQWDSVRSLFLTGGGAFTGIITAGDLFLVVELAEGKPWVSFLDPADGAFRKVLENGGIWNLKAMGEVGRKLDLQSFGEWTVDITKGWVDGEVVFCVDIEKEEKETLKGVPRSWKEKKKAKQTERLSM